MVNLNSSVTNLLSYLCSTLQKPNIHCCRIEPHPAPEYTSQARYEPNISARPGHHRLNKSPTRCKTSNASIKRHVDDVEGTQGISSSATTSWNRPQPAPDYTLRYHSCWQQQLVVQAPPPCGPHREGSMPAPCPSSSSRSFLSSLVFPSLSSRPFLPCQH